jgi:hypothetical protein
MSDLRTDLKATESSIRTDARRLEHLEGAKEEMEPTDPEVDVLSEQAEEIASRVLGKAVAERELAARLGGDGQPED